MNARNTKPSDQSHRVQVESNIICCWWMCSRAWAGAGAPFEVRTAFVGEGAEVKVRLVNSSGKVLEKKSDKIFANRCRGTIAVPSKVKLGEMLHLEAELPKHNLDTESDEVPAGPVIQARKLEWDRKEAKRGDTVTMKAEFIDLPDKTQAEVTVYEYSSEGLHDPVAAIPIIIKNNRMELKWELKYQNDVTKIPTKDELQPYGKNYRPPQYFFVVEIDGTRIGTKQESGLLEYRHAVEIRLQDENQEPMPDMEYILRLPDGTERKGKLDAEGKAVVNDAPAGPVKVKFTDSKSKNR
jgi:hypothetical protein